MNYTKLLSILSFVFLLCIAQSAYAQVKVVNEDGDLIILNPDGTWKGKARGAERASIVGDTKAEVMSRTIEIAKNQQDSQVIIHKKDGEIQEERTYGNDPHPPKG